MRGAMTSYLITTLGLAALAVILVGVSLGAGQAVAISPGTIATCKPTEGLTFEQALDLRSRLAPGAEMAMTGGLPGQTPATTRHDK